MALSAPATAQVPGQPIATFELPASTLDEALKAIGRQSGREVMYPEELVRGRSAQPLSVRGTADDAIRTLLRGTGLEAEFRPDVVIIRGRLLPSDGEDGPTAAPDVIVTGTRIRGADSASPRLTVSRETLRRQGFTDLGGFARSLPQNYSGGQNPGVVGNGSQGTGNENVTSSSTLNLRGLGPDATLTLINGHRVAFDAVSQGIDISAVPLLAVERVEVITDGASAIYGSDAVGGVANIILRQPFDGVLTSARYGTTSRGGATQYQVDGVAGATWASGGVMAALSFVDTSALLAGQRPFTRSINASATLLPEQEQVSGVIVVSQRVAAGVDLSVDAQFNRRRSFQGTPFTVANSFRVAGFTIDPTVRFFAVSPTLGVDLPGGWKLTALGSYSESNTTFFNRNFGAGAETFRVEVRYRDRLVSGEVGAEGPLLALPGGDARLSVGGGHRSDRLLVSSRRRAGATSSLVQEFADDQHVTFAYGELFAPVVGQTNTGPLLRRLELSAATRWESYAGGESVVTPKVGLVYSPARPLVFKASWGKSFKAPTLYQLNLIRNGSIAPLAFLGVAGAAPTDAFANLSGGNPDLRSERATTWSVTAQLLPLASGRLSFEASLYRITFDERVVSPIASYAGLIGNPLYTDLVTLNPTTAQIAAATATLPLGFTNATGRPVSTLRIAALVDNSLRNAASQRIGGVDLTARYELLTGADRVLLFASASRLKIEQRLSANQPISELTGNIFRPPHWRARGSADWDRGAVGASMAINYIGPTIDRRFVPAVSGRGFGTLDLVGRARTGAGTGILAGLEATLSVLNVFDRLPDVIRNSNPANPPFESTNYPASGRTFNVTLLKRW